MDYRFDQFTEQGYREFLQIANRSYEWRALGETSNKAHVILRHDVDMSPHRALALARIETEQGVRASYFFMLRSDFYNLLETSITDIVRQIAALGHKVGLHFDMSHYATSMERGELEQKLSFEKSLIESTSGTSCDAFSFHNPDTNASLQFRQPILAGMHNAYATELFNNYKYISDSNGYWRYDDLFEKIKSGEYERLYVLIHPEWWVPEATSPRNRVLRAVDGRKNRVLSTYDAILQQWGRTNVS